MFGVIAKDERADNQSYDPVRNSECHWDSNKRDILFAKQQPESEVPFSHAKFSSDQRQTHIECGADRQLAFDRNSTFVTINYRLYDRQSQACTFAA